VSETRYVLPKYNGLNGTYWLLPDNSLKLTSRGGDELPPIPHLESYVRSKMKQAKTTCLNGELYIHGQSLQNITSAVKKPKELSKRLEFLVFEFPLISAPFSDKVSLLDIPVAKISTEEQLEELYEFTIDRNLEGIVIYNTDATYKFNERSSSVLKYKPILDAEYIIRDYNVDRNGHPVFVCETPSGQPFKVKPKGTNEERLQIIADFETKYRNQYYTIEYEMLSDAGVPLKGVGVGLRACDQSGEPTE
jgi:DNA ligase-1